MSRLQILRERSVALLWCVLLLADLAGCVLLSLLLLFWAVIAGQEGAAPSAFETMSARAGRAYLNHKLWGRIAAPAIDWTFAHWQGPIVELPSGLVFEHPSHCIRAFMKLRHLAYLPGEYSAVLPPSLQARFRSQTGETP